MRSFTIVFLVWTGMMAVTASAASVSLIPENGSITGVAGQTAGWGFDVVNDSPFQWISFATSFLINETNPSLGVYVDLIGAQGGPVNFALAPQTPWTEGFSGPDGAGA